MGSNLINYTLAEKWKLVRGSNLKPEDRHVLLTLFLYQGEARAAYCRQDTLAAEIGITTRSVRRSLHRLNEAGIVLSEWIGRNGYGMRHYAISFDRLKDFQRPEGRTPASYLESEGRTPASSKVGHQRPETQDTSVLQEYPLKIQGRSIKGASLPRETDSGDLTDSSGLTDSSDNLDLSTDQDLSETDPDLLTARWMFSVVQSLQHDRRSPNFREWAQDIRLMRERDHRTDADIRALFIAADADPFWRSNVRCPSKLRKQWDTLDLKLRKSKPSGKSATDAEAEAAATIALETARRLSRHKAEQIKAEIGERSYAVLLALGLRKVDEATDFDLRELKANFVRKFNQEAAA